MFTKLKNLVERIRKRLLDDRNVPIEYTRKQSSSKAFQKCRDYTRNRKTKPSLVHSNQGTFPRKKSHWFQVEN